MDYSIKIGRIKSTSCTVWISIISSSIESFRDPAAVVGKCGSIEKVVLGTSVKTKECAIILYDLISKLMAIFFGNGSLYVETSDQISIVDPLDVLDRKSVV